ncbi:MAG: hypothetical protein WCO45_13520 [Pseudanabaena sp. ELA607]|jgi:hypothetical protein
MLSNYSTIQVHYPQQLTSMIKVITLWSITFFSILTFLFCQPVQAASGYLGDCELDGGVYRGCDSLMGLQPTFLKVAISNTVDSRRCMSSVSSSAKKIPIVYFQSQGKPASCYNVSYNSNGWNFVGECKDIKGIIASDTLRNTITVNNQVIVRMDQGVCYPVRVEAYQ